MKSLSLAAWRCRSLSIATNGIRDPPWPVAAALSCCSSYWYAAPRSGELAPISSGSSSIQRMKCAQSLRDTGYRSLVSNGVALTPLCSRWRGTPVFRQEGNELAEMGINLLFGSPLDKSLCPAPPISRVSPVRTQSLVWIAKESRVRLGVCRIFKRMAPSVSECPSFTRRSTYGADEKRCITIAALNAARSACAPE